MASHDMLYDWIDNLDQFGDKPAVIEFRRNEARRWTFQQLDECSGRFAAGLAARGIEAGSRVALLGPSSGEWIAACLGLLKASVIPVPVDTQIGDEGLKHILEDSGPRLILAEAGQADRLEHLSVACEAELLVLRSGDEEQSETPEEQKSPAEESAAGPADWHEWMEDTAADRLDVDADDTAVLFYTSGTTGPPKGVPLTQRNIGTQIGFLHDSDLVGDDDRLLLPLPLHHVYPFVVGMVTPLARGLPVLLPHSLTGPEIVRALKEGQATILIGVPRLYRALSDGIIDRIDAMGTFAKLGLRAMLGLSSWTRRVIGWRLGKQLLAPLHARFGPALRVAACGGSPLDDELAWRLESLGWQVGIGYGLTETSPLLTLNPPGTARIGTVGRPTRDVEIRIAPVPNVTQSEDSEASSVGEVIARGPNVFQGYWNLPDKTKESFTEDGWFRTGDLGTFDDDGYLRITGRKGTMLVTPGGENVQPDELERVYSEADTVHEIGVLSDEERLVALVVPEPEQRGASDVKQNVQGSLDAQAEKLPSYKRLHEIRLTQESLPRTRLGKIQRHKLRQRYEQAADGDAERPGEPVAPEDMASGDRALLDNPDVRKVWDMLAERYADQRLTPDSSVRFDLGLDSLDWIDLSLAIRREVGVEIDEQAMGEVETVRELLQEVAEASGGEERLVDPGSLEDPERALSDRQRRYLEPHGWLLGVLSAAMFHANRGLMRLVFRLEVEGAETLPDPPFVITPNHTSYLDAPAVAAALPRDRWSTTYWGGWTGTMFTNPLMRIISRLGHVVPVDPRHAALSSLAFGGAVLKRQNALVWFPEGERSPDGELVPFRPGIGLLLQNRPAMIVPTVIEGPYEALPRGRRIPRLRKITVRFGRPRALEELRGSEEDTPEAADKLAAHLREIVREMQERQGTG